MTDVQDHSVGPEGSGPMLVSSWVWFLAWGATSVKVPRENTSLCSWVNKLNWKGYF